MKKNLDEIRQENLPAQLHGAADAPQKTNALLNLLGFSAALTLLIDWIEIEYLLDQKAMHVMLLVFSAAALMMTAMVRAEMKPESDSGMTTCDHTKIQTLRECAGMFALTSLGFFSMIIYAGIEGEPTCANDCLIFSGIYGGIGLLGVLSGYNAYAINKTLPKI